MEIAELLTDSVGEPKVSNDPAPVIVRAAGRALLVTDPVAEGIAPVIGRGPVVRAIVRAAALALAQVAGQAPGPRAVAGQAPGPRAVVGQMPGPAAVAGEPAPDPLTEAEETRLVTAPYPQVQEEEAAPLAVAVAADIVEAAPA